MFWINEEKTRWFGICLLISGEDIESVIGKYRLFFFFFSYWVFKEIQGLGNICVYL